MQPFLDADPALAALAAARYGAAGSWLRSAEPGGLYSRQVRARALPGLPACLV